MLASVSQQTMTDDFFTCEDLSGAEALFQKAAAKPYVGVELLCDREDSLRSRDRTGGRGSLSYSGAGAYGQATISAVN